MDGSTSGLQRCVALGPEGTVEELIQAGLRDRDYENLSTGERMRAHAESGGSARRLVCDCADIEPGVEINRWLLASQAPLVVEGARIAALATCASEIVFHVGDDDRAGRESLAEVEGIETVSGAFRPNLKGYEDVPTLILTGETLMNIARVLRDGARSYRGSGTAGSPGTKLFQVTGTVNAPGIYELPLGTTLRRLIDEVCGGVQDGRSLQAVIVGGSKGAFLKDDGLDLSLDFDSVRDSGGIIGSGAVAVLATGDCIIDETKRRLSVSCYETCGACTLGREGSYQLAEIVADMTRGRSRPGDLELLREISQAMRIGCACASGRSAPNLILSGMERFPEEYEAHMRRRRCRALVCAKYVTFHILPDLCDGCGVCAEECPEDAIVGGRKKIHVIDQDACEQCGRCYEVCLGLQKAVVKAGPVKPRTPKRPIPVGSWEG